MNRKIYYPMRNFIKHRWEQRNAFFCIRLLLSCLAWYTAIYWVADSRYNRELARLEARVTNIITRLEGNNWRKAIEDIPVLQRTLVPSEPLFFDVISVYKSLNPNHDGYDTQIVMELSKMLIAHKEELDNLNLSSAIINASYTEHKNHSRINLNDCNFTSSNFAESDLRNVVFFKANLQYARFPFSNMTSSQYKFTNLSNTNFSNVQMNNSFFNEVKLNNTNFKLADLENSYVVGVDFSRSINLSTAYLESAIYNSKEITDTIDYHPSLKTQELEYCQHKKLKQCFLTKYLIQSNPKTLFPDDFDPKAHGMIDLSDFIDFVKNKEKESPK